MHQKTLKTLEPIQILREGVHALVEAIGSKSAVCFLNHLESGPGSRARKRRAQEIEISNEDIVACVEKCQKKKRAAAKLSGKK